ncbi:MAG: HYR domain-containing protein [Saprospiraceae bacterium]
MMINFHKHKFRRGMTKPNLLEATSAVASTTVAAAAWKNRNMPFQLFSKTIFSFLIGCFCSFSLLAQGPIDNLAITLEDDITTFCADPSFCNKLVIEVSDALGNPVAGATIIKEVRGPNAAFNVQAAPELSNSLGKCPSCLKLPNPGKDTIIVTAIDQTGNPTLIKRVIIETFDDTVPPKVECPKELCVFLEADGTLTVPLDSFKCDLIDPCGLGTLSVDKNTFSCADMPYVDVTVTFASAAGSSNDIVTVLVKDTFPPVVTCVDTIKAFLGSDGTVLVDSTYLVNQGFAFNDYDANSCGITRIGTGAGVGVNIPFDCSDLGTPQDVTITIEDASGNIATCETVIKIVDKESPKLTCPSDALIEIELGDDGLDTFIISESGLFLYEDNCATPPKFEQDTLIFSCADIGTWSKKIILVDDSDNKASCYRNFSVEDVTPPAIVCQFPITGPDTLRLYLDIYGEATISPDTLDGGTKDSCSTFTLTARQTVFTCNDITPLGTGLAINLYATDIYGNIDSCQNIIQVFDTIAPLVFCKDSIVVLLDSMGVASVPKNDFFGLIKDECGIIDTVVSRTDFDCRHVGIDYFVDVTVTDIGGRATTCQVKVIVKDEIAPVLTCKEKITLELGTDGKVEILSGMLLDDIDENCRIDTVYVSQSEFFCSNIGTHTVSTTVVDESGNASTCSTEVTIIDNMSPITVCNSITVLVGDGGQVTINPSDVDGGSTDNCGIINMSVYPQTFDCSDVGSTVEVILTTTDASNNSSNCRAWVTVAESSLPVAKCKSEVIVQLDANGQGSIEVADVDDGSSIACNSPSIALSGRTAFDCADIKNDSIYVTLIVTDASGNQDSCKSKIIVEDNIAPTVVCADGTFNLPLGLNGTAILPVNFMDAGSSDACGIETRLVQPNTFTCDDLGLNDVALIVIDSSGNADTCYRVINVVNSSAPNLVCKDIEVYLDANGKVNILPEDVVDKTASDCFGNIALALTDSSFTCADKGANSVTLSLASGSYTNSCTAIVTVLDTLAPIVNCHGAITVEIDDWGVAMVTLADVLGPDALSDNCDIKDTIWTDVNFSCMDIASSPKEVSVTVTDSSGNATTCTTNVTVVDNKLPEVIDCPTDTVLSPQIQCKANYKFGYPDFSDNCGILDTTVTSSDTNVNLVMEGDSISGLFKLTTTITFTVTDASGNQASCDFKIAVEDTHKPTFGNTCPTYPVQYVQPGECGINFVATNLAPQDNCGIDTYICTFRLPNGDIFTTPPSTAPVFLPVGTTNVSHVITDFNGNQAECSYTITVADNEAPTLTFNNNHPNYPLGLYTDGDTLHLPAGTIVEFTTEDIEALDNCEIDELTFNDVLVEDGVCASKGYDKLYRCTWTATDLAGNTTQLLIYIKVACPVVNTPDLQPNFTFGGTSYMKGDVKMVIININEIENGPTSEAIKFFLPKSTGFTYDFNPTLTSANVLFPRTVNNQDWTVQDVGTGFLFTSTAVISPLGKSSIGIRVTADSNGAQASMTVNIQPSAGGENRADNNVAVLSQSIQN